MSLLLPLPPLPQPVRRIEAVRIRVGNVRGFIVKEREKGRVVGKESWFVLTLKPYCIWAARGGNVTEL